MRITISLALAFFAIAVSAQTHPAVVGTWEGESVCQVPKPCTTEHVIYEITGAGAEKITIKADKVVNGEREWMGDLQCSWAEKDLRLNCPMEGRMPADWAFELKGDTLTGTLVMREEKKLFRKIEVKRVAASKK